MFCIPSRHVIWSTNGASSSKTISCCGKAWGNSQTIWVRRWHKVGCESPLLGPDFLCTKGLHLKQLAAFLLSSLQTTWLRAHVCTLLPMWVMSYNTADELIIRCMFSAFSATRSFATRSFISLPDMTVYPSGDNFSCRERKFSMPQSMINEMIPICSLVSFLVNAYVDLCWSYLSTALMYILYTCPVDGTWNRSRVSVPVSVQQSSNHIPSTP